MAIFNSYVKLPEVIVIGHFPSPSWRLGRFQSDIFRNFLMCQLRKEDGEDFLSFISDPRFCLFLLFFFPLGPLNRSRVVCRSCVAWLLNAGRWCSPRHFTFRNTTLLQPAWGAIPDIGRARQVAEPTAGCEFLSEVPIRQPDRKLALWQLRLHLLEGRDGLRGRKQVI